MNPKFTADGRDEQGQKAANETTRRTFVKTVGAAALASGLGASAAGSAAASDDHTTISFDFSMLPDLPKGHYEGWAIFGDEKVSTGTFSKGDDYSFDVDRDLSEADKIAVTIESDDDESDAPSGVVVLVGELTDGTANLSFPASFDKTMGSYILATPTDGGGTNETSGVWFLDPSDGPSASLDLPDLPSAWTYEGWVVHEGQPISTGRFDDPAMGDDSDAYAGDVNSPPPFPGADLIQNAPEGVTFPTDLTDGKSKVVVSVEPDIDGMDPTGPKPFQVKPLAGKIPADGTDHTNYDLGRKMGTLPSGMATVNEESAGSQTVSVDLETERVGTGGMVDATISLSEAPSGLSGYELTVHVDDTAVATLTDGTYPDSFSLVDEMDAADDGSSITLKAADIKDRITEGASDIELATVTLRPQSAGETSVGITVDQIDADDGTMVSSATMAGSLTVTEVAAIDGSFPQDIDGDGRFEDLNGNGRIDSHDVVMLFKHKNQAVVTDHADAYDFNGNGRVDFDDVTTLFDQM